MAEANLGALVGGTLGDRAGERVHVSGRAVVDDRDSRHGPIVPPCHMHAGIIRVPSARPSSSGLCVPEAGDERWRLRGCEPAAPIEARGKTVAAASTPPPGVGGGGGGNQER